MKDKLTLGKISVIQRHPFFAAMMLERNFVITDNVSTACTDGKNFWFNQEFLHGLSVEQTAGLICHQVMHIVSFHHTRRNNRDPKLWNYACDYAINLILKDSNVSLPEGGLIEERFRGLSAEQVYRILQDEKFESQSTYGEVIDGDGSPDEIESQTRNSIVRAATIAKMQQTDLPTAIKALLGEVLEPQVNWKEVLSHFVTQVSTADYTFSRPNRRYIARGFGMPTLYSEKPGEIVLMVDTSGSIFSNRDTLERFLAEMQAIIGYGDKIQVLYIDTRVRGHQELEQGDSLEFDIQGGGCTDFRPGFKWLTDNCIEPSAVIYFTDLECDRYPVEPSYPVLWVNYGRKSKTPFGDVLNII